MRIKDEFKKAGYFWLPSAQENRVPGTLVIADGGNIELEIVGLFDESIEGIKRAINGGGDIPRIVGQIEKHGLVTLDDCFYTTRNIPFGGISKSNICVNKAFVGVIYEQNEIPLFNQFKFSVEGIDEWVGISGIMVESQFEKRTASIKYVPPEEISITLNNGMGLFITFSWTLPGYPNLKEASISQKTYFKLTSEQPRPLGDFISASYIITTLLCFAIDKTVCVDQVTVTSDEIRQDFGDGRTAPSPIALYYGSLPHSEITPKISRHQFLFRFVQIQTDAERIVNNWFDAYKEIDPALNLYFSAKTGVHKYLDGNFLALAQGLETYHRRTSNEKLMDEPVFEELRQTLISECPETQKEWLSARLAHGNEINLGRRIKLIIEPFKELIGTQKLRKKLIRSIVDTRNYRTHYDKSLESTAVTGRDLWLLCQKMEAIFQLHLLHILGFTQSEIRSVFENSNELRQKLKQT